jgi:hypothetical protein
VRDWRFRSAWIEGVSDCRRRIRRFAVLMASACVSVGLVGCDARRDAEHKVQVERLELEVATLKAELAVALEAAERNAQIAEAWREAAEDASPATTAAADQPSATEGEPIPEDATRDFRWRWEPRFSSLNAGIMTLGDVPDGFVVRVECEDPVAGKLLISGNGEKDVAFVLIDPATANWITKTASGGSIWFGVDTPNQQPPPESWFRVSLQRPE